VRLAAPGILALGGQADDPQRLINDRDAQLALDAALDRLPGADGELDLPLLVHAEHGGEAGQIHRHLDRGVDEGQRVAGEEHQFIRLQVEGEAVDQRGLAVEQRAGLVHVHRHRTRVQGDDPPQIFERAGVQVVEHGKLL